MIKAFLKVMAQADEIVAHNGDRFDLKWLRTRALLHGLDVMPSPKTIDTLKWAKRYFNFNSNKLDYIAKYLGVGQKMGADVGVRPLFCGSMVFNYKNNKKHDSRT
jgi:DNA polymerase III epsilon subunit-like protein